MKNPNGRRQSIPGANGGDRQWRVERREFKYRLPTAAPMALGVGFSYGGNSNDGVRVGLSGEF